MFANYLTGLREGLEASLVVCILIAYLVKSGRRDALLPVWAGIGVAVLLALGFGAGLTWGSQELTFEAQEALGGSLSILAVGLVSWMVFWMRRTARHLKSELHGKLDAALQMGTVAVVATAFLAVGREGLETALFVWASVRALGDGTNGPLIGVALGLATAVLLGWLFYLGAVRINLAKFFTWTGGMLLVVAAGVLAYGVHDLQEARFLGGLSSKAFDVSEQIPPDSWYGTLLKGVFNFQPDPTVLQVTVWALYLVPMLVLFFAPVGFRTSVTAGTASTTDTAGTAGAAATPETQRATHEDAHAEHAGTDATGGGAGDGGGPDADGERLRDRARRAGGRPGGDEG